MVQTFRTWFGGINGIHKNEINAAWMEEIPQVIDGALISSAGVTSLDNITEDKPQAIAVTEEVKEVQPKALIREEVAANS